MENPVIALSPSSESVFSPLSPSSGSGFSPPYDGVEQIKRRKCEEQLQSVTTKKNRPSLEESDDDDDSDDSADYDDPRESCCKETEPYPGWQDDSDFDPDTVSIDGTDAPGDSNWLKNESAAHVSELFPGPEKEKEDEKQQQEEEETTSKPRKKTALEMTNDEIVDLCEEFERPRVTTEVADKLRSYLIQKSESQLHLESYNLYVELAQFAIADYNQHHSETVFKDVELVKVNVRGVFPPTYFITFSACDVKKTRTADRKTTFQARVSLTRSKKNGGKKLHLCRPKPN